MKKLAILLFATVVAFSCSKNENPEEGLQNSSNYKISVNGQTYENQNITETSARFTEGTDITTGKKFYTVAINIKGDTVQITAVPYVSEGVLLPISDNTNGQTSSMIIFINNKMYIGYSGTITIKKDNRYNEMAIGGGAKTGNNEILVEFSGVFLDLEANETPISGSFYVAKK